jgi:hypothetical protein
MGLHSELRAYKQWKTRLRENIRAYRDWLETHGMAKTEALRTIEQSLENLQEDRLKVAFVAEFSRGKTELINAMFFADHGRRLLPSTAGRTTMCPVELFYDTQLDEAYVRLLPIETRLEDTRLAGLKQDPRKWVHYPLALHSPEQIEQILREIAQTKRVSVQEAGRLGLFDQDLHSLRDQPPTEIDIPRWRHAMISFPHPLLKQGLVLIDTPGLNALGSEPELTLDMLPSAQGVVFVLAADTGVTRSDLDMWRNHLRGFQSRRQQGLLVALNKVDTLWDELQDEQSIQQAIGSQRASVATILGIKEGAVFPVSAQKALLAKVRGDRALLERSGVAALERYLTEDVLNAKHEMLRESVTGQIGAMIERTRGILATRLAGVRNQREELAQLGGQSQDLLAQMTTRAQAEKGRYHRAVESFRTGRAIFQKQGAELLEVLNPQAIEAVVGDTEHAMKGNWTTIGLQQSMQILFDDLRRRMQQVVEQSENNRKIIRSIYSRFQSEHGFPKVPPPLLSTMKHRVDMELLYQEVDVFRKSPSSALTEKHFLIKRFSATMVLRAREICQSARADIAGWLRTGLDPLSAQLQDRKISIERRIADLKRVGRSKETLRTRLEELNTEYRTLSADLTRLRHLQFAVATSRPSESAEAPPGPRLVRTRPAAGRQ